MGFVFKKNKCEFGPENWWSGIPAFLVESIRTIVNEKVGGLIRKQQKINTTETCFADR
jgi:hypothetical protein